MIENLRFVEREIAVPTPEFGEDMFQKKIVRVLQAYDGHVWFDVPLYVEKESV